MYLMYIDESGDCGINNSPTSHFILSALIVHELRWLDTLNRLIQFRSRMKHSYKIGMREELHTTEMFNGRSTLWKGLSRNERFSIYRHYINEISGLPDISVINIVVSKQGKPSSYDVFENAWKALIQRFENTVMSRNFPGPANPDERGMLFPDRTDDKKLKNLARQLRRYNPIPNSPGYGPGYRNQPLIAVIEDPNFRDSHDSYFTQTTDVIAYALKQKLSPNSYIRRKGGRNLFDRLQPVLCLQASRNDPLGVVCL